jgi:hypothetical protein
MPTPSTQNGEVVPVQLAQHLRWKNAKDALWNGKRPPPKPSRPRPVSPFVREARERQAKAMEAIGEAFPPPGHHHLFTAPIEQIDDDGNVVSDRPKVRRCLIPKWKEIAMEVGKKHGVTLNELQSVRRSKPIVIARHECFWRCRHETSLSFPQIGKLFGGRDHSTVLHGIASHEQRMREAVNG